MGSNKLRGLGTRPSAPSCSGSALSHLVQTCLSLFTPTVMRSSISWFMCNDLIIKGSDPSLVDNIIQQLDSKFSTKNLGVLSFLCGVEVLATSMCLLLSQQKYVIDLLRKNNILDSKPVSTPLIVGTSLTAIDGFVPINSTMYLQVVGGLQHLRMTCPDISFLVNKLSKFMCNTPNYTLVVYYMFRV